MHDNSSPPTSTVSVASQFRVYCLTKSKQAPNNCGAAAPLPSRRDPAPPTSFLDVVQQLDGSGEWSFAPYPPCSRAQLLQVHAYWVAIANADAAETQRTVELTVNDRAPKMLQAMTGASTSNPTQVATASSFSLGRGDDTCAASSLPCIHAQQRLACVVGIVWVRLSTDTGSTHSLVSRRAARNAHVSSSRPSVEGYIQVVVTHQRYRRRGLASWLLAQCVACTEAPAGVFVSDRGDGVAYAIQRWHLHTLAAERRTAKRSRGDDKVKQECQQDNRGLQRHPQDADYSESEREGRAAMIDATLAMYRRLGFQERRYLPGYYAGKYDAVELMKICLCP